jgi:mobilome CxxCx(11)CxxC protein
LSNGKSAAEVQPPRPEDGRDSQDAIRIDSWNHALHATATAYLFEQRAMALQRRLQLLGFVGLAGPLIVGALALSYGAGWDALPVIIVIASAAGVVQVAVSLWSLTANWVTSYEHASRSLVVNRSLAKKFEDLGRNPPAQVADRREEFRVLEAEDQAQRREDYRHGITDMEKRIGMRAALIKYRRQCASCNEVPANMTPTECGVCGDFDVRRWNVLRRGFKRGR